MRQPAIAGRGRSETLDAEIRMRLSVLSDPNEEVPQRIQALERLTGHPALDAHEKHSVKTYRALIARLVGESGPIRSNGLEWYTDDQGRLRDRLPL